MSKIYTVHDAKAAFYGQPFFCRTNAEAIRSFSQVVNDSTHQIGQNHSDFTLFEIGEYDDQTGVITAKTPTPLGNGVDFKAQ